VRLSIGSSSPAAMVKRVLIVVSSYRPAMPASMHRARLLAWCLAEQGWEAEILAPSAEFQQPEWMDPAAAAFFSPATPTSEAKPVCDRLFRLLGMHSAGWRGFPPVYSTGATLLKSGRFDLVYISTTAFNLFCLGRLWQRRFGVPYVLDFQDPWFRPRSTTKTTRHRFKAWVGNWLSRYLESFAVGGAKGLIAVSPDYLASLSARYPRAPAFAAGRSAVIPFGVRVEDFSAGDGPKGAPQKAIGLHTISYVGVGDVVMQKSFRRLVAGLARVRRIAPDIVNRCRIHLSGTQGGWREGERKVLWNEAKAAGVGDVVVEDPGIVSYSEAVSQAVAADGLLVLGVDDPAYMPSKLFLYALTGKPLLACMHWASQVNDHFQEFPDLGSLIHFAAPEEIEAEEDLRLLGFFDQIVAGKRFARSEIQEKHSAGCMTRRHVEVFEACLSGVTPSLRNGSV